MKLELITDKFSTNYNKMVLYSKMCDYDQILAEVINFKLANYHNRSNLASRRYRFGLHRLHRSHSSLSIPSDLVNPILPDVAFSGTGIYVWYLYRLSYHNVAIRLFRNFGRSHHILERLEDYHLSQTAADWFLMSSRLLHWTDLRYQSWTGSQRVVIFAIIYHHLVLSVLGLSIRSIRWFLRADGSRVSGDHCGRIHLWA